MNYVSSNMSKKKRIIKAIIILLILSLLIYLVILKFKNSNKKTSQKNNNELLISDYSYLFSRLYPNSCAVEDINVYNNLDKLDNDIKIEVAISSLSLNKVEINEDDEYDLYNDEKIDYDWIKDFKEFGVEAKDVDTKVKEIFGENTVVHHQSTEDVIYDKTTKVYINPPHGCGNYNNSWFQTIDKVTKEKDEINIYTIDGSLINQTSNNIKICYDDNYKELDEKTCILLNQINKKYMTKDNDLKYDYEKYAVDNKEKFNQYKYIFIKENNNYIFKKMEKIK